MKVNRTKPETPEVATARKRAELNQTPEAIGGWIRSMVSGGFVSQPASFSAAVADVQTMGATKAEAVATCVAAYPELHQQWLASGKTSVL